MLGVVLTVVLVIAFAAFSVGVYLALDLGNGDRRRAKAKALGEVKVSRNHQDLFLLVLDLVTLQERGYLSVFPDDETLERAKRMLATYREIGT